MFKPISRTCAWFWKVRVSQKIHIRNVRRQQGWSQMTKVVFLEKWTLFKPRSCSREPGVRAHAQCWKNTWLVELVQRAILYRHKENYWHRKVCNPNPGNKYMRLGWLFIDFSGCWQSFGMPFLSNLFAMRVKIFCWSPLRGARPGGLRGPPSGTFNIAAWVFELPMAQVFQESITCQIEMWTFVTWGPR